jgi:O-antigen ligase
VVTWKGASVIFLKNSKYIFGSGSEQDTRVNLLEYYRNYDGFDSAAEQNRFINKNYNTHNQYINELLRGGFVGLLLLIIPQAILLYKSVSKKNVLSFMFLVSIMSFSFVENILARQIGVYLFALLLSLSSISYKERE